MTEWPRTLALRPLAAAAFAPYGEVLDFAGGLGHGVNHGTSIRRDLPAGLDLARDGGRPALATFSARGQALAGPWSRLERHVQGSQSFVPLQAGRWVVLVARGDDRPDPATLAAFSATPLHGITLAPGTWHHPLIALDPGLFLVIERAGEAVDCEEVRMPVPLHLVLA